MATEQRDRMEKNKTNPKSQKNVKTLILNHISIKMFYTYHGNIQVSTTCIVQLLYIIYMFIY